METALRFYAMEAHAQWIAEPYVPIVITLDRHLYTLRSFVVSLNQIAAYA